MDGQGPLSFIICINIDCPELHTHLHASSIAGHIYACGISCVLLRCLAEQPVIAAWLLPGMQFMMCSCLQAKVEAETAAAEEARREVERKELEAVEAMQQEVVRKAADQKVKGGPYYNASHHDAAHIMLKLQQLLVSCRVEDRASYLYAAPFASSLDQECPCGARCTASRYCLHCKQCSPTRSALFARLSSLLPELLTCMQHRPLLWCETRATAV